MSIFKDTNRNMKRSINTRNNASPYSLSDFAYSINKKIPVQIQAERSPGSILREPFCVRPLIGNKYSGRYNNIIVGSGNSNGVAGA